MRTKEKVAFLLVLPVVWLAAALAAFQPGVDGVYVLAVAPAAWLFVFEAPSSLTARQLQMAGLPGILVIGLLVLALRPSLRAVIIASIATTLAFWGALVATIGRTVAAQTPRSAFLWLLCCFNLSLCLLPFSAAFMKLAGRIRNRFSG